MHMRVPVAEVEPAVPGKDVSFQSLVREYVQNLPQQIQAVRAALEEGDLPLLATLSHKIKGAAGMYGLTTVGETAGLVEEAVEENQELALLRELVEELGAAVNQSCQDGQSIR